MLHRRIRSEKNKTLIKIGRYGEFSPEQARVVAKDYIHQMWHGENTDPKKAIKLKTITVKDLYSQYISSRKTPLATSTVYQYESWINHHFKGRMTLPANTITTAMVIERLVDIERAAERCKLQTP